MELFQRAFGSMWLRVHVVFSFLCMGFKINLNYNNGSGVILFFLFFLKLV